MGLTLVGLVVDITFALLSLAFFTIANIGRSPNLMRKHCQRQIFPRSSPLIRFQGSNIKAHTLMVDKLAQDFLISIFHSDYQGGVAIDVGHIG